MSKNWWTEKCFPMKLGTFLVTIWSPPVPVSLPSMASQNEEIHYETKPKFMGVVYCEWGKGLTSTSRWAWSADFWTCLVLLLGIEPKSSCFNPFVLPESLLFLSVKSKLYPNFRVLVWIPSAKKIPLFRMQNPIGASIWGWCWGGNWDRAWSTQPAKSMDGGPRWPEMGIEPSKIHGDFTINILDLTDLTNKKIKIDNQKCHVHPKSGIDPTGWDSNKPSSGDASGQPELKLKWGHDQ